MMPRHVLLVAAEIETDDDFRIGREMRVRAARYALARRLEGVAQALRNGQEMGVFKATDGVAAGVFLLQEVDDEHL